MLKQIRQKHNLSQEELAERIGITQSHLSRIENYRFSPQIRIFINLSKTLDICFVEIMIDYYCISCDLSCDKCILKQLNQNYNYNYD